MISFEKFVIQDDIDKYNMLLECGAEINALEKRINTAIEYLEQKPVVMVNGEPREIYVEDDNKLLKILKGEPNNE